MAKKALVFLLAVFLPFLAFAQSKYALVIGNGTYTGNPLTNPVNDARDMKPALESLGFQVDLIINGNLTEMESAVIRFKNRLSVSQDSYGFFFYAGHGVQSNGENYLIPANADIPAESFLKQKALGVQAVLAELDGAGNALNVIVLDACRDNPFSWSRSGSRGLANVSHNPRGSIIMYATSAGSVAEDGTGRNGLFTTQLLKNLKTPELEVKELFNRTGLDVFRASNGRQHPELSIQFFETAYLGTKPSIDIGNVTVASGSLEISTITAGTVEIRGAGLNQKAEIPAYGTLPIGRINAGTYTVKISYAGSKTEEQTVEIGRSETKTVSFNYRATPAPTPPTPTPGPSPTPTPTAASDFDVSRSNNRITITKYKGNASVVNIPGEIEGATVIAIGEAAFYERGDLTSITIPNSVTSIGTEAFSRCSSLTSITIPNSVTSIGKWAFAYCRGLTSITIPNSVTSIGDYAFSNCGLTSIAIPNSVTYIGYEAFSNHGLTSINVNSQNPSYSSQNGVLFSKDGKRLVCYPGGKSGTYTIPNSVTSIGDYAFSSCERLTSITIPNSVTYIGGAAFASSGLISITIPKSVTYIGRGAFSYCSGLSASSREAIRKRFGDGVF